MILSPATRLKDRQTVWVARHNDGTPFYQVSTDWGVSADSIAASFREAHAGDVRPLQWDSL